MMSRIAITALGSLLLAACATSHPDRPESIEPAQLEGKALVVGSIAKPADHDGFGSYAIDMVFPQEAQAYRFRVEAAASPFDSGFPADAVMNGHERSYFLRFVEPGTYIFARHEVAITNTFTTYTFGEQGRLTRPFTLAAGDVVYVGEHLFVPNHDNDFFLWREVTAPSYQLRNDFDADRKALETLYPGFDWSRMQDLKLQLEDAPRKAITETDVWVNPFGILL